MQRSLHLTKEAIPLSTPSSAPTHTSASTPKHTTRRIGPFTARLLAVLTILAVALSLAGPAEAARKTVRKVVPRRIINFNIVVSPDALRVQAGQVASFPVRVIPIGSFSVYPKFEIDGVPDEFDAEIVTLSRTRYTLRVFVPANSPSSNGVYQLIASSGSKARVAGFRLVVDGNAPPVTYPPVTAPPVTYSPVTAPPVTFPPVTAPPQFDVRADVNERTASTGETATFGITVDRSSGFGGPVSFTTSGLPADMRLNFAPNPTTSSTNLYVTPGPATPSGRYILTIVGTSGSTQRAAAIAINVNTVGDFALIANPTTRTVAGAISTSYRIDIATALASRPKVAFDVSGVPTGIVASFSATSADKSTDLKIQSSAAVPSGTYPLTITGRSGPNVRQIVVNLVVNNQPPGFGLSATPGLIGITRGSTGAVSVAVNSVGGFSGAVTITTANLPAGVTVTRVPDGLNPATLLIQVPAAAPPGQSVMSITGTSGIYTATVQVTLIIT